MSKQNLEETIRNIMSGNQEPVNEEQQLDEFKVKTPKLPEIPDIKVKPDLPEVKPTPKVEPDVKPKETPDVKPKETPDVKPKETPDGKTKVDTETTGKVKTDADLDAKAKEDLKTKTPEAEAPKGKDSGKKKTDTATGKPKRVKIPRLLPGITPGQEVGVFATGHVPVNVYMHLAKERMIFGEAVSSRTEIEYVPRGKGKRNEMGRQQSVEKQITEKRKETIKKVLKSETIVDQNPQTNDEPNEVNEGWKKDVAKRVASVGLGGAIGGAGYKADAEKTVDKPDRSEKKDLMGLSNKEYGGVDVALDLASMLPFIGTPAALASAARSYQRGDYVDTALDLASAIPGLGTVIKGAKAAKNAGRISKLASKVGSKIIGKETPARAAVGVPVQKAGIGMSDVATGAQLGDIGYKINQAAGERKSEFEKIQKDPKWKNLSPEQQKNVSDAYAKQSTFTGVASDVAKSMGDDLKRDVYNPIKSRVKKTVDQLGIGEEYLYEGGPKKIKGRARVNLSPSELKVRQDLEAAGFKFDKDGNFIPDKVVQPTVSPAELKAAKAQPEGGASNRKIKDKDGIDTNGSKKTDKPDDGPKPADVSNKVNTGTNLPSGKPSGASVGGWSPTQKRSWAAGLRPGAGALGAGALAAGLVGLGAMSGSDSPESSSSDTATAVAAPSTGTLPSGKPEGAAVSGWSPSTPRPWAPGSLEKTTSTDTTKAPSVADKAEASKKALPPSKIVDALQKKRKEEPKIKQQTSKAETPKQPTTPAFKANFTGGFGQTPTYGVTQPGAFKRGGLYDTRGK